MIRKLTANDIAREYFPLASENELEYIIWGETGFPVFWNIPEDGKTPTQCFRKQLREYKADIAARQRACWGCGPQERMDSIERELRSRVARGDGT